MGHTNTQSRILYVHTPAAPARTYTQARRDAWRVSVASAVMEWGALEERRRCEEVLWLSVAADAFPVREDGNNPGYTPAYEAKPPIPLAGQGNVSCMSA